MRPGVGYLAPRSSRHAGKHSDGYVCPLDARVGRAPTYTRGLNLVDPLSRLLLSLLTLLGTPRIASLRETPGRPAVRRTRAAPTRASHRHASVQLHRPASEQLHRPASEDLHRQAASSYRFCWTCDVANAGRVLAKLSSSANAVSNSSFVYGLNGSATTESRICW